jgi:hypothetical protein
MRQAGVAHDGKAQVLDRSAREEGMRRRRRRAHRDEPLVRKHRLDHFARAAAARHDHRMRLLRDDEALRGKIGEHRLARNVAIEAAILLRRIGVDGGVEVEDRHRHQAVTLADLPVVEIVRGGDLDGAGSEFAIDVRIRDQRNDAAGERQRDVLADEPAVALVVGIDRDRDVTQHRFRTCGCDDDLAAAVGERIADLPELALLLLALHFQVGHRGAEHGIPIHEALAAIDEAVLVQAHERLEHRSGKSRVHREPLARPVRRRAEPAHLARDRVARFLLPRPHALDERFAAQVAPRLAFDRELLLDHDLGGDTGVVGAHLPQRVVAAHAVIADQHVHQRLLKRVAHVQRTRHVRRRQLDAIRGRVVAHRCAKVPAGFPKRVPLRFDGGRLEALGEVHEPARKAREKLLTA